MAEIDVLLGDPSLAKKELKDASNRSDSPELVIPIARTFAILADDANAQGILARQQNARQQQGLDYGAAKYFIDGIEALRKSDFQKATEQLTLSSRMHQSPETTYFLAKAQMGEHDWVGAIESLNSLVENRARVFTESVASLIPLAEHDLSICYSSEGRGPEARQHLETAQKIWEGADPSLKALLKGR
jgi:hypothetical protein